MADNSQNGLSAANERTPLLSSDGSDQNSPPVDSEQQPGDSGNDGEQTIIAEEVKGLKLWTILATCWFGVFFGAIDASIIATLSAPISSEFQSLSLLPWLATAYLISNAACQPISGRLTDIFGRGPGLVFSNIFFAAGNLICGLAPNANIMILGRVVAGIGGGGLMTISTFVGTDLVPLRNRGIIQGIGNICYGAGAMLGGVFGGLINDNSRWGWRLAFLIQVPPVIVSAGLVGYLLRIPPKVSGKSYLARIDFTGALSLVTFLVLLLLGLNAGGNLVPWLHPLPLTTLPLSLAALVFFVIWEYRAAQPIIPIRLLFDRTVFAACITNLLCCMVQFQSLFYIPLYLQTHGVSAARAGLVLLFSPLGICISSVSAGFIMKKTGRYIALGIFAVSLQLIAAIILTTLRQDSPIWPLRIVFFLLGAGQGGMLTVTLLACLAAIDHSNQATITSATYAFRSVGSTVGVTIGSAIYQNVLKEKLWERFGDLPGAAEEIKRIRDDIDELKHLPEGWHDGVAASLQEAFQSVWFTLVGLAAIAVVTVSLMKQHKLHSTLARK
ncbi:major facilitator superfamily domain-containing protein [Xylaria bambusicola]|uniref:major facilitator superfamily domain-containing protein n=1 Tax=Xylaria bambusicola TaxID=326684 RepID=UPI002007841D|nr:major facilitator superfamily domain-containing protein [Xylaria bambusicola]KAI0525314.1 major facilitator superfamily domain-containing protein [Xylaria bambusicola]